ncbi:asparagine synthase-related protein [Candidatus Skiveiella danica]|uniref:asparagine synthase-related protein n=1 Tax=Candidatus Skiveiella danica TaxID=3386177 RepID=UPI0009C57AAB|nr:MAG: Asparagine synthetase (glutamine-hydrolyzing) 3 [Alphaproteobacteria bacterium ADurb.Bin100]
MSGIAGLIQFDGEPVPASGVARMLGKLGRRGPDRQTMHCDGNTGFAQALLATTPEANVETQPWIHPGSGCVVVSDSRLDDRPKLLRELGIIRPANDVGDGELLHAAWQRWGTQCADRLRGDFAFAIWNPRQQTLYAARDPMGVRPFVFHFVAGKRFVFGSTVEAVLAQGDVPAQMDEGRIADALFGETEGIDLTTTFYRAVQKLPPASWLLVKSTGGIQQQRYWWPVGDRPVGLPRSTEEWVEAQREQLDRAVKRRLRSHRPVGSMLSGGLDSSSVVALASKAYNAEGRPPFPVFSATNTGNPDCAETTSIHAMLSQRHCRATFVDLASMHDAKASEWWEICCEPFDGSITLASCLYRAASSQGIVSLMDGVPADNLFVTGYPARRLFRQWRLSESWRAALEQWTSQGVKNPRWPALRTMIGCLAPTAMHSLRDQWKEATEYRALTATSIASVELLRRVNMRERYRRYRSTLTNSNHWHQSGEALSCMAAPYITAGLERFNRVASLFGVEPRPPFTDRDLIEFQAWVPVKLRIRDGHAKWVLREAMRPLLPYNIAWRTDKSHIGWAFNRAVLAGHLEIDQSDVLQPPAVAWLDAARLKAACEQPEDSSVNGLAAALRLLVWVQNQVPAVHP